MKLTKQDMDNILNNYNLGKFKKFGKIMKDDKVSYGRIIYTSKKKVFMKIFRLFDTSIRQGLIVSSELHKKGFPTYEIYETENKKSSILYEGERIVFLEYLEIKDIKEWPDLSIEQIRDFSKQLAIFHKHTSKMKLKNTFHGGHNDLNQLIKKAFRLRKRYNKKIQKAIIFMNNEIKKLRCKSGEKKAGYFSEFNPGHVRFNGNKVEWIIDWEIGYDYTFYDWGSSLESCFDEKKKTLSYEQIKEFIKSYNSIQKLSRWEKEHIYEALLFGVFKYGVWGLIDLKTGGFVKDSKKVDMSVINKVLYMMEDNKENFRDIVK